MINQSQFETAREYIESGACPLSSPMLRGMCGLTREQYNYLRAHYDELKAEFGGRGL